ncbi:fibrinogen-binding adhesin SdrG C-terminal domain-containing protein, partial [Staphylococcus epidermidis]|uniref:fibrinogen-binding adhesin SdrG C-terminal domain-containing protein n=1 Tax=Staphylococcus epidermidis TaxID=1282 RepID=UPI001642B204
YISPLRYSPNQTNVNISRNADQRSTIIHHTTIIKLYNLPHNQNLPHTNTIYHYTQYQHLTNHHYPQLPNNNHLNINFPNIHSPYIIKVIT